MTNLSSYLAASCLYAAFGLPYMMGVARIQPRPAPARAPSAAPIATATPTRR